MTCSLDTLNPWVCFFSSVHAYWVLLNSHWLGLPNFVPWCVGFFGNPHRSQWKSHVMFFPMASPIIAAHFGCLTRSGVLFSAISILYSECNAWVLLSCNLNLGCQHRNSQNWAKATQIVPVMCRGNILSSTKITAQSKVSHPRGGSAGRTTGLFRRWWFDRIPLYKTKMESIRTHNPSHLQTCTGWQFWIIFL